MQSIKEKKHMKQGYIENLLLWMVMFIIFVTLLFFVINYATLVRIKDNMNSMSDYAVSKIAVMDTSSTGTHTLDALDTVVLTQINNMKIPAIATISGGSCSVVSDGGRQVTFTITTGEFSYRFYTGTYTSKRVVYNENNSNSVDCNLTISINE